MSPPAVEFRPAGPRDADWLGPRLRAGDLAEIQAVHGEQVDPTALLHQALAVTPEALAAVARGQVVALLGCAPAAAERFGVPWLLGSDEAMRYPRVFVAAGRAAVRGWLAQYGHLENQVDVRNVASLRWLQRLGFEVHPPRPYGAQGLPFSRFTRYT